MTCKLETAVRRTPFKPIRKRTVSCFNQLGGTETNCDIDFGEISRALHVSTRMGACFASRYYLTTIRCKR